MRLLLAAALAAAALAIAALASPALADEKYDACVDKGMTDADYRECGSAWLQRADDDLNAAWKELRKLASEETAKWLLEEQRAWNTYKEASCMFWGSGEYGTMGTVLSFPPCRAEIIEARTAQLREYHEFLREQ